MDLTAVTERALKGTSATAEEALAILRSSDDDLMAVVAAASRVRRHFFGTRVKLNYLVNLKSGMCPEDCTYCSQSLPSEAGVLTYSWLEQKAAHDAVRAGIAGGASRVCLVASGRGPSDREVGKVASLIEGIKEDHPQVDVCACLGFVDEERARRLQEAGADRYNHNLNTAASHYDEICSTHGYDDRAATVHAAQGAGLSACSGLIAGMGETDEQLVEVAIALRELGVDSVPVNFLLPFEGTPLQGHLELTPQRCLRILAMMRFIHPDTEVRAAAGREYHLRSLQPLALEVCNSIFLGDYLTSEGQAGQSDLAMIADMGFTVEGADPGAHGSCSGQCEGCDGHGSGHEAAQPGASPELRRRGAGTDEPANV